ncbi:hypothetical protein MMPV_009332 [Pyropia vietnamensis]
MAIAFLSALLPPQRGYAAASSRLDRGIRPLATPAAATRPRCAAAPPSSGTAAATATASSSAPTATPAGNTSAGVSPKAVADTPAARFAAAIAGDWRGYESSFSVATGTASSIPAYLIPDEFRQWNVAVTGYETLTSSVVLPPSDEGGPSILETVRTRALPAVGCENDAVVPDASTFTAALPVSEDGETATIGFSSGAYASGRTAGGPAAVWEVCLLSPPGAFAEDDGQVDNAGIRAHRRRMRVLAGPLIGVAGAVTLFAEGYFHTPSRGAVLPGCGGGADVEPLPDGSLEGAGEPDAGWVRTAVESASAVGGWTVEPAPVEQGPPAAGAIKLRLPRGVVLTVRDSSRDGDGGSGRSLGVAWEWAPGQRVGVERECDADGRTLRVTQFTEVHV